MNCEECREYQNQPERVPYAVHEISMGIMERTIKRLWIALLIVIVLLVATNGAWLWYESQFETVETVQEVTQEADNGTNNFIGGDYNGEADNQDYYQDPQA